ncbi:hypothetical protein Tco_0358854 [Tanacetum coccineum]
MGCYRLLSELMVIENKGHVFPPHPTTIISDSDVEDTFSSTHSPDYIPASPDYFPASPGNTSPNFSLALSPFYNDQYMKVMQAYDATDNELPIPSQAPTAPPTILPPSPMPPKRTSTSAAPAMTQAAIRQLVANSVAAALEAQAATNLRYMLKNVNKTLSEFIEFTNNS